MNGWMNSAEKAQREEMKKLKSFLKQVLKRAAEVGAADPPSQLPLKEQVGSFILSVMHNLKNYFLMYVCMYVCIYMRWIGNGCHY